MFDLIHGFEKNSNHAGYTKTIPDLVYHVEPM